MTPEERALLLEELTIRTARIVMSGIDTAFKDRRALQDLLHKIAPAVDPKGD